MTECMCTEFTLTPPQDDESELSELSDDVGSASGSGSDSDSELSEPEHEPVNGKGKGQGRAKKAAAAKGGKKAPAKKRAAAKPKTAVDAVGVEQGLDGIKTDNGLFSSSLKTYQE